MKDKKRKGLVSMSHSEAFHCDQDGFISCLWSLLIVGLIIEERVSNSTLAPYLWGPSKKGATLLSAVQQSATFIAIDCLESPSLLPALVPSMLLQVEPRNHGGCHGTEVGMPSHPLFLKPLTPYTLFIPHPTPHLYLLCGMCCQSWHSHFSNMQLRNALDLLCPNPRAYTLGFPKHSFILFLL